MDNSVDAAAVSFIWALSPSIIRTSFEARQYSLLALFAVILVWQVLKYTTREKKSLLKGSILLALSTAAGALTFYYFAIVVAGCGLFLIVKLVRKDILRLIMAYLSILAGYVLFFFLYPQFYLPLLRELRETHPFQYETILPRFKAVLYTICDFFVFNFCDPFIEKLKMKHMKVLIFILIFMGLAFLFIKIMTNLIDSFSKPEFSSNYIFYFFLWISFAISLLFVLSLSPEHTMGQKYLSMAWPFFAFVPIFCFRFFKKHTKLILLLIFCVWQMFQGGRDILRFTRNLNSMPSPKAMLEASDFILIDHTQRGILPPLFWDIPDDKNMFGARQGYLLREQEKWVNHLTPKSIYISEPSFGNSKENQENILNIIRQKYDIKPYEHGIWELGNVFILQKRN